MTWHTAKLPEGKLSAGVVGLDDTVVTAPRWNELAALKAVIGQCRTCQGNLVAEPIDERETDISGNVWFVSRCLQCGKEIAAPNGRILRRSSAHAEMPEGAWERRESRDREQEEHRNGRDPA